MNKTLAIMAAGLGQRYGGLKQVDPVRSHHILLEYAIYDAVKVGFNKVAILIRQDFADDFKMKYGARIEQGLKNRGVELIYVYQPRLSELDQSLSFREKMGGTGHAVLCFQSVIDEPFVIINADDFYGRGAFKVVAEFFDSPDYDQRGSAYAMVAYKLKNVVSRYGPVARGICEAGDGFLQSVYEHKNIVVNDDVIVGEYEGLTKELSAESLASMNFWGFNASVFKYFDQAFSEFISDIKKNNDENSELFLPKVITDAINSENIKVKVLSTDEKWFGMTYQSDKDEVKVAIDGLVSQGFYPDNLWG